MDPSHTLDTYGLDRSQWQTIPAYPAIGSLVRVTKPERNCIHGCYVDVTYGEGNYEGVVYGTYTPRPAVHALGCTNEPEEDWTAQVPD